jgi:hypothetical protein
MLPSVPLWTFLTLPQSTFQLLFEASSFESILSAIVRIISVNNMPLKGDPSSTAENVSLRSAEIPVLTIKSLLDGLRVRTVIPILQAVLILIALCLQYLRVHHILLLGFSLNGWVAPLECIVFCIMIIVLAIQQRVWETQLLKDALRERQ